MSDYRRSLGWNKLEIITRFNEAKTGEMVSDARLARELLDVTERWHEEVRITMQLTTLSKKIGACRNFSNAK